MKLYHYVHCPFCLRVRMALGFLGIEYTSTPLAYDDEKTPVKLCHKKMLPIFEWAEGDAANESLDIIARLDEENVLRSDLLDSPQAQRMERIMSECGAALYKLTMPLFVWTKEFDEKSREYFQRKKELSRGPFNQLVLERHKYMKALEGPLAQLEGELMQGSKPTILDIILGSFLWGLYLVPEFQFSPELHDRLQQLGRVCHFDYHEDLWRDNDPMSYQRP